MFLEELSRYSLQSLRIFSYVATYGTVAEASHALHLTQPAVSLQISNLEEQLGFKLFDRQGRRNVLTPRGEAFLQSMLPRLETLEQALVEFQRHEKNSKEKLSIGSVEGVGEYWLAQRFDHFAAKYENLRFFLEIAETSRLEEHLITGRVQLVVNTRKLEHPQVVSQVLMNEKLLPVGTQKMILKLETILEEARRKKEFEELDKIPWIGYGDSTHVDYWASRWLENLDFVMKRRVKYQHHVNSYSVIKTLLLKGRGVCVAPLHTCQTELESGELVSIESKRFPALKNKLYISYRQGSLDTTHKEFLEWLLVEATGD